ncbi:MAG TPA: hypothetical protein VK989_14965, partial [Polyangia bacterium]|nr:hypothetical protein [Polyangia bacterium]
EWFDEETVLRDVGEDQLVDDLIAQRWSSLSAAAAAVRRCIERISVRFSDENFANSRARFHEGQRRRVARLFGDKVADQLGRKR